MWVCGCLFRSPASASPALLVDVGVLLYDLKGTNGTHRDAQDSQSDVVEGHCPFVLADHVPMRLQSRLDRSQPKNVEVSVSDLIS